ncbi:MAG: hypothetical protein IJ628_10400 [Bacteroidaceae bacterium]|nr:hypothetical protein [Bacteroidaceae bacterium]
MEVKVNRSDIIWSYLGVIVSFTASIITLPIVIYYLDADTVGLWYVFNSVGAITILFDFGFSVTFARNINYCWSGASKLEKKGQGGDILNEPDFLLMRNILYTCKRIYLILSSLALLLMLTIGTVYILHISSHISGHTHIIAWIIFSVAAFLNLYFNYYDSFLRGVGAVKRANQNRIFARSVQLLLVIVSLTLGFGLLGLSISYLVFGIVFQTLGNRYFYSYQNIRQQLNRITRKVNTKEVKELFRTIWYNAWRDGLVSLSIYLSGQASVIICSLYLSLSETGTYSVGLQIANVVAIFSATLYTTYQPALQHNWIKKNMDEVRRIMRLIVLTYIITFFTGSIAVITVGLPILKLIRPEVIISTELMAGLFISQFIIQFRNCYTSYFSCTNRLDYMPHFVFASVLTIILSIVFIQWGNMKTWGLIIAQIISQCIFNIWYWPIKAHREMHQPVVL